MASQSPTKHDLVKNAIREIAVGTRKLENRLENDVTEVCELLIGISKTCKAMFDLMLPQNLDLKSRLQNDFSDIYCCLKLHLASHLGEDSALNHEELEKFGRDILELSDEQMNALPDGSHAIDPGSKLLETLSYIVHHSIAPRGSEKHADEVMKQAKSLFSFLSSKNIFRPKVLVKVSHDGKFFVGCSISVSSFLRPLCLHLRVKKFKRRLKEAVVFSVPLRPPENQAENWSSSAFIMKDKSYTTPKDPCRNCREVFRNLNGFISPDLEQANRDTFLGACAEYIPVDELIKDDTQDSAAVKKKLEQNLKRCFNLFKHYLEIIDECDDAYKSNKMEKLEAAYAKVKQFIHIFGYKPEIRM